MTNHTFFIIWLYETTIFDKLQRNKYQFLDLVGHIRQNTHNYKMMWRRILGLQDIESSTTTPSTSTSTSPFFRQASRRRPLRMKRKTAYGVCKFHFFLNKKWFSTCGISNVLLIFSNWVPKSIIVLTAKLHNTRIPENNSSF